MVQGSLAAGRGAFLRLLLPPTGSWQRNGIELDFIADGGTPVLLAKHGRYPTLLDNDVCLRPGLRPHIFSFKGLYVKPLARVSGPPCPPASAPRQSAAPRWGEPAGGLEAAENPGPSSPGSPLGEWLRFLFVWIISLAPGTSQGARLGTGPLLNTETRGHICRSDPAGGVASRRDAKAVPGNPSNVAARWNA